MNELGKLQLIWIRRLSRETERIRTLKECDELTRHDINKYIKNLSQIDEYCKCTIENKEWTMENIENNIEYVEDKLFVHFYNKLIEYGLDYVY